MTKFSVGETTITRLVLTNKCSFPVSMHCGYMAVPTRGSKYLSVLPLCTRVFVPPPRVFSRKNIWLFIYREFEGILVALCFVSSIITVEVL